MTLATAYHEIGRFLNKLKLLPTQKKFLQDINQRTMQFHHTFHGWLNAGSVNAYKNKIKEGVENAKK